MICPRCGEDKTRVYGTRKGLTNWRFRECMACGYKFTTKEILTEDLLSSKYNDYLEKIGEIGKKERKAVRIDDEI